MHFFSFHSALIFVKGRLDLAGVTALPHPLVECNLCLLASALSFGLVRHRVHCPGQGGSHLKARSLHYFTLWDGCIM